MRTMPRTRRYLAAHWLLLMTPLFRYSFSRDAYVLRIVGNRIGPVLRADRRVMRRRILNGPERRRAHTA